MITQQLFLKIIIFIVRNPFRAVLRYRQNYKAVDFLLNDPMTGKEVTLKLRLRILYNSKAERDKMLQRILVPTFFNG